MTMIETWLRQDLLHAVQVKPLNGNLFSDDNNGNLIGVEVFRNGEPETLSGSVNGYVVRADGATIPVTGSRSGNKASIVLPASCYAVVGQISIVIKNGNTTIGACSGYVYRSTTEIVIDPGTVVPNLSELLAQIGACEEATTRANNAATGAEKVNVAQAKSGNVITVTTTDRDGVSTEKTLTEPTAVVSKQQDGPYNLTVTDANGTTTASIPDVAAEVIDKAYTDGVTAPRTALGNPIHIDDGVEALADKLTVHIEPVQDLHGYDHPWIGGSGKNLLDADLLCNGNFVKNADGSYTFTKNGLVLEDTNGRSSKIIEINLSSEKQYFLSATVIDGTFTDGDYINWRAKVDGTWGSGHGFISTIGQNVKRYACITSTGNVTALQIYFISGSSGTGTDYITLSDIMLEEAVEEKYTDYEPYENICPITGFDTVNVTRTGKNLCPNLIAGLTYSATTGRASYNAQYDASTVLFPFDLGSNTITLSYDFSSKVMIFAYDSNMEFIARVAGYSPGTSTNNSSSYTKSSFSVNLQPGKSVDNIAYLAVRFYWTSSGAETDSDPNTMVAGHVQLEVGSTATAYEPYKGQSISVNLSSVTGGTVYGGTLTMNRDGSGTVVVDRFHYTYDGTETFSMVSSANNKLVRSAYDRNGNRFPACLQYTVGDWTSSAKSACSHVPRKNIITSTASIGYYVYLSGSFTYPYIQFRFPETRNWAEEADVKAFFAAQYAAGTPVQVVYEIAEPQTYNLTAAQVKTLNETNHVFCDAGEMELVYRTDKYITVKEYSSSLSIIAEPEEPVATRNHAVGDMFVMDGAMYRATAAITTGQTITPGTNCNSTSVQAEINALRAAIPGSATGVSF